MITVREPIGRLLFLMSRCAATIRSFGAVSVLCLLVAAAGAQDSTKTATAAPATPGTGKSATTAHHTTKHSSRKKKSSKVRGQQKIDAERAQAIQEALIREHYLKGEATGVWNQASEEAMRRYQADNGWQSKTVPDSRALIKLGLGPSKDHLLNPESAMTTVPDRPKADPVPPTSQSATPTSDSSAPAAPPSAPASNPTSSGPQ
jgi:hypothetical protein